MEGHYNAGMAISSTGDMAAFADTAGCVRIWSPSETDKTSVANNFSKPVPIASPYIAEQPLQVDESYVFFFVYFYLFFNCIVLIYYFNFILLIHK